MPNFFIDKFRIPPFLLPIYQAAGIQYGIRWEVLAAINEIETDYGRNLNVSSAGALGWMQFMPPTWDAYGVDANGDGQKDPFNPVDAIFAAARYLRAAGADKDLYRAIFAYNHADWYVESVLMRARVIGGLPADLVGSLTGLTQGRFPVAAKATYAGALPEEERSKRFEPGENVANVVESDGTRRSIRIYSRKGAPVIAVQDGRISRIGHSRRHGDFVELQDSYGNSYLYAGLGEVAKTYPFPKQRKAKRRELALPEGDPTPRRAASATTKDDLSARPRASRTVKAAKPAKQRLRASGAALPAALPAKERLFANPDRPNARPAGGDEQLAVAETGSMVLDGRRLDPRKFVAKPLKKGARVVGGTILGRIGKTRSTLAPHVRFEIRPAGRGAPRIDPKPILDGWKLLESTAIYRSAKRNPFFGEDAETPSIGQIMLMSKQALQRHVLRNPHIDIYECGRHDVATGQVDRRVLATLEFLAASGLKPTVSSIRCGHGVLHRRRQRVRALERQRGRHRRDQRHHDHPRDAGRGLDHRPHDPAPAHAPGHDEAAPDHLADDVRGHGQHVRHGRPRRPHPRRLPPALRRELAGRPAHGRGAQARPVDQADRPHLRDRQPRRARAALQVLGRRDQARLQGAPRRVAGPRRRGPIRSSRAARPPRRC